MSRLREALAEVKNSLVFTELDQSASERMALERAVRVEMQIEQIQRTLLSQISPNATPIHEQTPPTPYTSQVRLSQKLSQHQQMEAWQRRKKAEGNVPPSPHNR